MLHDIGVYLPAFLHVTEEQKFSHRESTSPPILVKSRTISTYTLLRIFNLLFILIFNLRKAKTIKW